MEDDKNIDLLSELIKGTNFEPASRVEVLTQRDYVSTPLDILNNILGGGIPFGTILQSYGPPKCFPGSTEILTSEGSISLEDLFNMEGTSDLHVYSYDTVTDKLVLRKFEAVYRSHQVDTLYKVYLKGIKTPIRCTHDHPFLVSGRGYVKAEDLSDSDYIAIGFMDATKVYSERVLKVEIEKLDHLEWVYGVFEVEGTNNYLVTVIKSAGAGVVVSNSGKSTWMYETLGNFQREYPNGISVIIDTESSADGNRLEYLGVDTSKVLRLPSTSIESGFLALLKMLENKSKLDTLKDVPVFVIWDTISKGLAQDSSTQSRMNAQDRARVIKNYMSPVLVEVAKSDFILCLINQVIYVTDRYGNTKPDSGGGVGLKHDVHLSSYLEIRDTIDNQGMVVERVSKFSIDKSKLSPEVSNLLMVIDVTKGGKIDTVKSTMKYLLDIGLIDQKGGWYTFESMYKNFITETPYTNLLKKYLKSYRWDSMVSTVRSNSELYTLLNLIYCIYLGNIYGLQKSVMESRVHKLESDLQEIYKSGLFIYQNNIDQFMNELNLSVDELELSLSTIDFSKGKYYNFSKASYQDSYETDSEDIILSEKDIYGDTIKLTN